jgi:serine/threonine protein kinase
MLSERLAQGQLASREALRYAAALADALRRLHDQGTVVGTLEPSRIMVDGTGVKLLLGESAGGVTPYTSPEQLQGQCADARSDIFAFGAIVYEMVAGRKAFEGSTPDEIRTAILENDPTPLAGDLGRVTSKCLGKAAIQRFQRMQRVQMELKLQTVFARRGEQEPSVRLDRVQAMLREAIGQVETSTSQRFAAQDHAHADLYAKLAEQDARLRVAAESEHDLRNEIAALQARLDCRLDSGDGRAADLEKQMAEHGSRMAASEQATAAHTVRLDGIDRTLERHDSSLESLESAITQTDDLVERVVEAFDALEKSVVQDETRAATADAHD